MALRRPLGQYQWGVWDKIRTPGYHQDHSPLRVYDPTPYHQVAWGDFSRSPSTTADYPSSTQIRNSYSLRRKRHTLMSQFNRVRTW
jgi:hypothetical protein